MGISSGGKYGRAQKVPKPTDFLIGIISHPVVAYLVLKTALLHAERSILWGTRWKCRHNLIGIQSEPFNSLFPLDFNCVSAAKSGRSLVWCSTIILACLARQAVECFKNSAVACYMETGLQNRELKWHKLGSDHRQVSVTCAELVLTA